MLSRVPNRGYSTGFMKGNISENDYQWHKSTSHSESVFVGNITEEKIDGKCVLEVRNKIRALDKLEVLHRDGSLSTLVMPEYLETIDGNKADFANHSQHILIEKELEPYTILRRLEPKTQGV